MRKHRIFGVVIAVLIGLGVFTHQSDTPHRIPGTDRAGRQLESAELTADRVVAGAHAPVVTDPSYQTGTSKHTETSQPAATAHTAFVNLVAGHAVTILSSPFGTQALVADLDIAQLNERAQVSSYLTAVAQSQAATKAYLEAVAPRPPTPAPARAAVRVATPRPAVALPDPWAALRQCESNGNYGDNTGNGYYGAYQFNIGTWRSLGLGGLPSQATAVQQDQAAQELQARRGWGQWPSCARRLGLV
jgi:hypothetical protein